jgi:hypothetical protein
MDVETTGRTIELILAPVVMVTACGLLLGAMMSHYAGINARIRALAGERLSLSLVVPDDDHRALARERLVEIDHEVPLLVARHRKVHHAVLLAHTAVVILVVSMFVIAAAALTDSPATGTVALFVFLTGCAALMVGAAFMAVEIRTSQVAVVYEASRVADLPVVWLGSGPASTPGAT